MRPHRSAASNTNSRPRNGSKRSDHQSNERKWVERQVNDAQLLLGNLTSDHDHKGDV
ncbi:hypothetical protein K440DRAFT_631128 [Wilcoxina mikolae CBS 423.85]|nr:hypothetical protein K440DRAFT_631128 [Wilcoxina mikolae CBS 423.85]